MKKILFSVLSLLLVMAMLVSCSDPGAEAGESESDTVAEQSSDEGSSEALHETLEIVKGGKSDAFIIYPTGNNGMRDLGDKLALNLERTYGVTLKCVSDTYMEADPERVELLIGETNRSESIGVVEKLTRGKDYVCELSGKKLILAGKNEDSTQKAINYFVYKYVTGSNIGGDLIYSAKFDYFFEGTYAVDLISCGGTSLEDYRIVYPKASVLGEYYAALNLQYHMFSQAGILIPVTDDSSETEGKEILVGQTNRGKTPVAEKGKFSVTVQDGTICVSANDLFGYLDADTYLTHTLFSKTNTAKELEANFSYTGDAGTMPANEAEYRVIFNNCWGVYSSQSKYYIENRDEYAVAMYLAYQPDVIALNEYWDAVRNERVIKETLEANGYSEVDVSEDYSQPNVMPVFYKTDRLKVVESKYVHYTWYATDSATEPTTADRSKGVTIVVFEDLETRERFIICNTHFSSNYNVSQETGKKNRLLNIETCMETLMPIMERYPEASVLLGCDYNARIGSDECNLLLNDYAFVDCHETAEVSDGDGSSHGYPIYDETLGYYVTPNYGVGTYADSIDHIFQKGDSIEAKVFDTLTTAYAALFSDHSPLLLDFNVN